MFKKNKSLQVSERFFNLLEEKLKIYNTKLDYELETFNNYKEQGLILKIYNINDLELCIWSCKARSSDNIMVIAALPECKDDNNLFDNIAYYNAEYFHHDDFENATNWALNIIKKHFSRDFIVSSSFKFDTYYSITEIERISYDAENLDYEDYHDLATFDNSGYFCDLIILDGKMGLRYSKYLNAEKDEFDNISFEPYQPDLTSEVTLMLGMKQRLENFIDKDIELENKKTFKI
ncbi:MAG: hypothetical protein IJ068_00340 [Bacilli bacterium]|nr:hypothetical protein [Bacilli bacterium]